MSAIPTELRIALASSLLLFATASLTQEADDVESIVEGRQSSLRDLGGAYKGITDELKKSSPAMALIQQYARQIDELSRQQHTWFPAGTGPQPGLDTKAKAEIWTKPAQFAEARKNLEREAAKFLQVAATNDVAAVKSEHRILGKTCEACHKEFREKED